MVSGGTTDSGATAQQSFRTERRPFNIHICFLHIKLIINIILDFKTGIRRKREKEKNEDGI